MKPPTPDESKGRVADRFPAFLCLAICCCLCAGFPALAEVSPEIPTPERCLLVRPGQPPLALSPGEEVAPAVVREAMHGWRWSDRTPPLRVDPSRCLEETVGVPQIVPLVVHLALEGESSAGGNSREALGEPYRVVAAPVSMWKDVPEELLPTFEISSPEDGTEGWKVAIPVDQRHPWRLRAIGEGRGSWWLDVRPGERTATLVPRRAPDRVWTVRNPDGVPLADTRLSVLTGGPGPSAIRKLADFRTSEAGLATVPALPDSGKIYLLASHPTHAPSLFETSPDLVAGSSLTLQPGGRVLGRFVTPDELPHPGVEIRIRGWLTEDLPLPMTRWTASGTDGRFLFESLPMQELELYAQAPGYVPLLERVKLASDSLDMGTLTLSAATELKVRVLDDLGQPVSGAGIRVGSTPFTVTTGEEGWAWLDVTGDRPVSLEVAAEGHIPSELTLSPPFAPELEIVVERALRVIGRFVHGDGTGISDGMVKIVRGDSFRHQETAADGGFDLALPAGQEVELELFSPRSGTSRLSIPSGVPGELRDLGDVVAPPGLMVTGRLLDEETAAPIAGARLWAPRPTQRGPLVSWLLDDLLTTRSDTDGAFELSGAPLAPVIVRVDAPGYARTRLPLVPEPDSTRIDLGDVFLSRGTTLEVRLVEPDGEPGEAEAEARVDLEGNSVPADIVSAKVIDGVARIPDIPPGNWTVSIFRGPLRLCEERVEVSARDDEVHATCRGLRLDVRGVVEVGGYRAGAGRLLWLPPSQAAVPEAVLSYGSGLLRQSRIFSANPAGVEVDIDEDGTFSSPALSVGDWDVFWLSAEGNSAGPRRVTIPETEEVELVLSFPGLAVHGSVVGPQGEPIENARIRSRAGDAFALSKIDGSFVIVGLEEGTHHLQARSRDGVSRWTEVIVQENRFQPPIELVVDTERPSFRVSVFRDGAAASGALIFLDVEHEALRILTANASGQALATLGEPTGRWRVAAHHHGAWSFGGWHGDLPPAGEVLRVDIPDSPGALLLSGGPAGGQVEVLAARGWSLSRLMSWIGTPPRLSSSGDLLIRGLPPGRYELKQENRSVPARVEAGEVTPVRLGGSDPPGPRD